MTTKNLILGYIIVSILVGIIDVVRAVRQEGDLDSFPIGDMEYVVPNRIYGIHNWIFLPSWIIIGIVKMINY